MNKKILLIVSAIVALVLFGGGFYYWKTTTQKTSEVPKPAAQQAAEDIQKTAASVSTDIGSNVSPDVTVPVAEVPDMNANPYKETNPFSDLKVNPFQ